MPLPENFVELVTLTVAVEPARVVTVKLDDATDATVPLTCGGVKAGDLVPPAGADPLGVVKVGEVAAGDDFDERLTVTRPAPTPTATTRTATINHVVRRLR
jgi:hypothetical protein